MAIPPAAERPATRRSAGLPALVAALLALPASLAPQSLPTARAQPSSPNQPEAIRPAPGLSPPPCPLVVPRSEALLQPMRIPPSHVPLKNGMGCLSAADAIYGPDGCPRALCGMQRGNQVPLPSLGGR